MQIRSKYDVTIFAWSKQEHSASSDDDEMTISEDARLLLNTLDNPPADTFSMLSRSPSLHQFLQHGTFHRKKGGGVAEENEEGEGEGKEAVDDIEFPDLRDVPFSVSTIVWNYIQATPTSATSHSIKRSVIENIFRKDLQFTFPRWVPIEEKTIRSVMQTFRDIPGDHGVYTLQWKLGVSSSSRNNFRFQVLENGQEVTPMCSFRSIDDWPKELVWFRVILNIENDNLFSFQTCTFNFLFSRQEKKVFGWTCADIVRPAVFKRFRDFFVEDAFKPILEIADKDSFFEDWTFVFTRSFHPIILSNVLVADIHRNTSASNRPVVEAALELAVDIRMMHSLLQTIGFRSSFHKGATPYLKTFLRTVSPPGTKTISAQKAWKTLLRLGTYRQKGISLPIYTIFLYYAATGKDSFSFLNGKEDLRQRPPAALEKDEVQEFISNQLDTADEWNHEETFRYTQRSQLLSLSLQPETGGGVAAASKPLSCFLLCLLDSNGHIVKEFSEQDLPLEEQMRVLMPSMFFVNEFSLLYRKMVEMEAELRLKATTAIEKDLWYYFLVPVLFCRKPSAPAPDAWAPDTFWNQFGVGACYSLIGKMKSTVEAGESPDESSYALLNFLPYHPKDHGQYLEWQEFCSNESMRMLFPLQRDVVFDEREAAEEAAEDDVTVAPVSLGGGGDKTIVCLDRAFTAVESNQDLVSPVGYALLMEEQEDQEVLQVVYNNQKHFQ